ASNNQLILLDENGVGLQARSLRSINLVGCAAIARGIEVQQVVIQRNPDFAVRPIHSHPGQHAFERWFFSPLLLPLDFFRTATAVGSASMAVYWMSCPA